MLNTQITQLLDSILWLQANAPDILPPLLELASHLVAEDWGMLELALADDILQLGTDRLDWLARLSAGVVDFRLR